MHPHEPLPALAEGRSGRPLLWWDLAFGTLTLLMVGVGIAEVQPVTWHLAAVLSLLAALALGYLLLGRAALRRAAGHGEATPGGYGFVVLLIAVIGVTTAFVPSFATMQALGYPVLWWIMDRYRDAVLASGVLALVVGIGSWTAYLREGATDPALPAVVVAALSFAFAVAMGTWISRIFERGEQYRALAEQLRASQVEVAALSESAGAAAERERLSRELHDTLTQTLTGLVMLGEQADRALASGDTGRARERVARVQAASRAAVEEARALVATMHPLGDGGLEQAIERVAATLRGDTGLRVRCELEALPLDRERQVVLLRATQEGLANARRHAQAEHVTVRLRRDGESARLLVEDDGVGPREAPPAADVAAPSGFGLSGLRDRVRLVGGEVRFGARAGGGSRLEVRVPLTEAIGVPGARGERSPA